MKKLKIGVSACLLGMKYRYDGTDKLDARIVERLLNKVEFVPVCPEVECGLEIPRPAMRLERGQGGTHLKVIATDCEIVLLCAPPIFRPLHAAACIAAGKHIFAEKPIATDPRGLRDFLKVVADAKAKNLSILSGTLHHFFVGLVCFPFNNFFVDGI